MSEKRLEFSLVEQKNINSIPIIIENSTGVDQSVKDLSLGSISFIQPCYTCGLTDDCHGHVGRYIIKNPLFKVCFKKSIEFILKTICPVCGMIKHQTIINLLEKIYKNNNIITTKDRKVFKEILINSKSYNKQTKTKCANDFCRIQTTSIQYTKNNNFIYSTETKNILSMENIYNYLLNLPYNFKRLLTPNNSFKTISPENVFYNENFLIPSNFIRQPNIYEDIVFDPFTSDLNSLIKTLNNGFMGYKKAQNLLDSIDNNQGFNPYNTNTKKLNLSILTNGTSKDSYLRKEINGKRVIGTARAVISPGIKIPIGYIEIPIYILNNLRDVVFYNYITKKYILEKLNSNNKDKQFIDYIKVNHNDITPYKVISLLDNHKLIAPVYGDMFETIKHPGQYICYSRQPSIHCWNFQSAEILEKKSNIDDKTINIPPSIGPSQNADYDGDEMLNKTFYNPSANIEQGLIVNSKNLLKHHCTGTVMFGFVQDQIVAANLLLHEEEISLDKSFLIYGEYSFMLEKKPTFTGRELISLIFPKHYTFNNVFKDGFLIVPNILTNMVSANSYNSIFNGLSQYYGNDYTITIIDVFKTILQNYLMYYGLSIKITDIVPRYELINEIELEVRKHVININNKLNLLKKDVNDNKIIITNHEEISDLKLKNIEEMTNKIKKYMINVIEKEYQKKDNVFTICYNMGYKLTLNDVLSLLCFTGQKKNKKMPIPTINGKTYLYDLPNDIDVETSGFITSPVIKGLSYNEYVIMIKEESLPQIVNVTSGTSQTGYMGKKIIKMTSEIFINNDRFMVSNKHIINFNPNFLKISVADTSKVLFVMPNDYFVWKKEINDLFNTNLKDYVIQKKNKNTYSFITELDFYVNINSEILIYYYKLLNKKTILNINHTKNISLIKSFYNYILEKYYFNLNDISYILYILLTHLDPSGYIYIKDAPRICEFLDENLINIIFDKIIFKLNYSLSSGTMFGYQIANTIQEKFTQQSLSSFHTTTKAGGNIQKGTTEEFKQILELSKKDKNNTKEDIVSCYSYNPLILEDIKNRFEYISLKYICDKIEIEEENVEKKYCIYVCDISLSLLIQKKLDINIVCQMLKKYCERCFSIQEYYYYININNKILKLYLCVQFKLTYKNINLDFNILKYYFKLSLWDGVHKGKYINNNLYIDKHSSIRKINNEFLEVDMYELKFFIESVYDFKHIKSSDLETILLPPWLSYYIGGIFYMKTNTTGKAIHIINDDSFIHSLKHFFDFRFTSTIPSNMKTLYDKTEIIKQANHGNNNVIVQSAYNNQIDYCQDIYSSLLVAQKPIIGTNYFEFLLNPNLFDKFKFKEEEITIDENEDIISII